MRSRLHCKAPSGIICSLVLWSRSQQGSLWRARAMRIIVAMTGATGAVCGVCLPAASHKLEAETRQAEQRAGLSARACAIVAPPMSAFNGNPKSIDDLVDHAVG